MIVVLPPDVPEPALQRLRSIVEARGWQADTSRGSEQTVLLVAGPSDPEELRELVGELEADVLPVKETELYRQEHRRRRFLTAMIGGLALLVLLGMLLPIWAFMQPPERSIIAPELLHVAGAARLPVGAAVVVRVAGRPIQVVRLAPRRWQAVSGSCTYLEQCLLEWSSSQQRLLCSCHGCVFDAHGNALHPPASIPLIRFEVVESGAEIYVRRTIG